jgi:hypothetical protein
VACGYRQAGTSTGEKKPHNGGRNSINTHKHKEFSGRVPSSVQTEIFRCVGSNLKVDLRDKN